MERDRVIYGCCTKLSLMTGNRGQAFQRFFFFNVAAMSNSHPDYNHKKFHFIFLREELFASLLTIKQEDVYKCSVCNFPILFMRLLKDFILIGLFHQFVPLYQEQLVNRDAAARKSQQIRDCGTHQTGVYEVPSVINKEFCL